MSQNLPSCFVIFNSVLILVDLHLTYNTKSVHKPLQIGHFCIINPMQIYNVAHLFLHLFAHLPNPVIARVSATFLKANLHLFAHLFLHNIRIYKYIYTIRIYILILLQKKEYTKEKRKNI